MGVASYKAKVMLQGERRDPDIVVTGLKPSLTFVGGLLRDSCSHQATILTILSFTAQALFDKAGALGVSPNLRGAVWSALVRYPVAFLSRFFAF